jgi:hypothetical protein
MYLKILIVIYLFASPILSQLPIMPKPSPSIDGLSNRKWTISHTPRRTSLVRFSMADRYVHFTTRFVNANIQDATLLGMKSRTHTVSYWPTAISVLSDGRLAVAGKTPRGETTLELWSLSSGGQVPVTDPVTRLISYSVTPPKVRSIEVIFTSVENSSRDIITEVIEIRGTEPNQPMELLVQFFGRDVISLNLSDGSRSLVLTETSLAPPSGVLAIDKAPPAQFSGYIDHAGIGQAYVFWLEGFYPKFALIDGNHDGVMDSVMDFHDIEEVKTSGLFDVTKHISSAM